MRAFTCWCAAAMLVLAAGGCARSPRPATGSVTVPVDSIWYISVRARQFGHDTRDLASEPEYGIAIFRRSAVADPRIASLDLTQTDSVQLTKDQFVAAWRARVQDAAPPQDYGIFYVHGFGTSLHEAWNFAAEAHARSGSRAPWVAFSWPSNGAGVALPTFREPLSQAYVDDSVAAVMSRPYFAHALRTVVSTVGAQHVMLVAHSLGGQLVGETLAQDHSLRIFLGASPLRAIAFVAPDVEARRFAEYTVPALRPLTDRLVLYASSRDRVLKVSGDRTVTRRAGFLRGAPEAHDGLETIDASDAVRAEGWLQETFGNHHAIGDASGALFDLSWIVGGRRPAACRTTIGSATSSASGVWVLADSIPAARAVTEQCETRVAPR